MASDDRTDYHLRLLQPWQLHAGSDVVRVAPRQQRLIAALAIKGARPRCYMGGLLWPDTAQCRAAESLRVSVHLINRQAPGLLASEGAVLSLSEAVVVDLSRFRLQLRALSEAEVRAADVGDAVVGAADGGHYGACLIKLRDRDLLPGWYEEWVIVEQNLLRQERLHACQLIARIALERGDHETTVRAAEAALELDPLYESAVALLIQGQRGQGNDAAALRYYRDFAARLKAEIGIGPSRALRRAVAGVRSPSGRVSGERAG